MKTLTEYAKENRIHYRTAWNAFKAGKIPGAFKSGFGKILIPDDRDRTEAVVKDEDIVGYARGSCAMNKDNLDSQGKRLTDTVPPGGTSLNEWLKSALLA